MPLGRASRRSGRRLRGQLSNPALLVRTYIVNIDLCDQAEYPSVGFFRFRQTTVKFRVAKAAKDAILGAKKVI
jgi:hypothetical protein